MKTPKKSLAALLAMTLTVGLTACSGETDSQSAQSASSQPAQSASSSHTQEESGFPFTLTTKDGQEVTFTHVPETIISCNPNAGDELMALGLGDKIIATAYNNTQVNPQWREEYEAIPNVAESYISLETILSLEPDFVYGRSSSFSEKNNTTHDTLSGYGIMSLSSIEGYTVGADVDVVYQDFYDLGRIFQVEDRAEEIVSAMKEQIAAVEEAVAGAEPVKVFVYDMAQEGGAYTCGDNFTAKLISHAGGVNIFEDMDTTWATVSWEEVVERAPEVIVINDYGSTSLCLLYTSHGDGGEQQGLEAEDQHRGDQGGQQGDAHAAHDLAGAVRAGDMGRGSYDQLIVHHFLPPFFIMIFARAMEEMCIRDRNRVFIQKTVG